MYGLTDGTITDNSGQQNAPTTLTLYVYGTPAVFGGEIKDGDQEQQIGINIGTPDLSANYGGSAAGAYGTAVAKGLLFTLTGNIALTGGTAFDGIIQIGDGENNGSIQGSVSIGWHGTATRDDENGGELIFDVVGSSPKAFNGSIVSNQFNGGAVREDRQRDAGSSTTMLALTQITTG